MAVHKVEFFLAGGQVIAINASDLQVSVVAEEDEDGNPNPKAGELTGFQLESVEEEKLSYLYVRVPQVDAIRATLIRSDEESEKPVLPPRDPSNKPRSRPRRKANAEREK